VDTGGHRDCRGEFINHEVADWLQDRDIAQTRSRPYQKKDQAHVESKNNHAVGKHALCWRYDTAMELELTPTKKFVGDCIAADGHHKRIYDQPATSWQRL